MLGPNVYGSHAAQLLQRPKLNLADALAGDGEALAVLYEKEQSNSNNSQNRTSP